MKHFCIYFAMLFVMCSVWIEVGSAQQNEADWMPDANLRAAVRTALSLNSGDALTQTALAGLTTLTANNKGITNLTGLEHATSLTTLDLRGNNIYDTKENIAVLKALSTLTTLYLNNDNVNDALVLDALRDDENPNESPLRALLHTPPPSVAKLRGTANGSPTTEDKSVKIRRRIIAHQCPVGWQRQTPLGTPTKRVLIRSVEVEVDRRNRNGIYKPVAIEIYAHPDEQLRNLHGWKLTLALPYNVAYKECLLTAENSAFNEESIARIEGPEADLFPMTEIGFIGQRLPGFDYRLFDEKGTRVDFGISCYKKGGLTPRLWEMELPRVERVVSIEDLDWDRHYYQSEWGVPELEVAPAAPSTPVRKGLVGTWAGLKK